LKELLFKASSRATAATAATGAAIVGLDSKS